MSVNRKTTAPPLCHVLFLSLFPLITKQILTMTSIMGNVVSVLKINNICRSDRSHWTLNVPVNIDWVES